MSWIPEHFDESQLFLGEGFSEVAYELVGEEVQRLSVVNSLPALLQGSDGPLCMQRIVPKILLALDKASKEFHVAAALTFYTILEKKLVHPKTYAETFLRSMVEHVDFKVAEVAAIWLDVLLDAIALLSVDAIRAEVLPVAIAKGQISQPVSSRIKSCKLLGKASLRLDIFYLKKEILPVILSLCQDVNHEVRACICTELSNIIKALDADVSKTMLLPSLVELASDEEALVRISAVSTIVEVLGYLTPDTIKNTIMPLVKKLANQARGAEDDVLVSISFQIGKLCLGLQNYMTPTEKQWILTYYQDVAQLGTVAKDTRKNFPMPDFNMTGNADRLILCRQNCAYNFPAMTIFCMNLGPHFYDQLYITFCALSNDPYFMVRRTIACGLHEVTTVLGSSCGKVKKELVRLLRDDVEEVLQGLIPNLSRTMENLAKFGQLGPNNMDNLSMELGRAVLKCEAEISETNNWRLHSMLMGQLECLPLCLPSEFLHNFFIPIIFTRIHKSRAVPCRVAAGRTLLVFLRYNPKAPQRNDLRTRIINEFCRGRSCFSRMTFTKICGAAMDIFSRHYFKEHFYLQLLELADDKVANVRMQLAGYFPRLKSMLRLPIDKKLLVALEASVRRMASSETDRDVRATLNSSIEKLDRISVRDDSAGPVTMTKDDMDDQRKAEEENRLSSVKADGVPRKKIDDSATKVPNYPQSTAGGIKKANRVPESQIRISQVQGRGKGPAGQSPSPTRPNTMASLEDEFYVDAGIRIPQQLAASGDLTTFPTRIPNLREILFKNRNINEHGGNSNTQNSTTVTTHKSSPLIVSSDSLVEEKLTVPTSATVSPSSLSSSSVSPTSFNTNKSGISESKVRMNQNLSSGIADRSSNVKNVGESGVIHKGNVFGGPCRPNSDAYLCTKDQLCSSSSKGKVGSYEQKQKDVTTIVSRRHSYMDGEKTIKPSGLVNKTEHFGARKAGENSGNRRHSYIEKVSADEEKSVKSSFVVKRNYTGTTNSARHSYMKQEQSTGQNCTKLRSDVILRKSAIPSRRSDNENKNSDTLSKRRSLIHMPQQLNSKINSYERRGEFEANSGVEDRLSSKIPKHPHSLNVESKRRHSSLERDDLEKLRIPLSYERSQESNNVHARSLRSSLECISNPKPMAFETKSYSVDKNNIDNINLKKDGKHHGDKLGYSTSDENLDLMIRKRNRLSLSKIPRGPASCHSSPGGSRASSPTSSLSNGIVRTRQRTAPNSRSTSPTSGMNSSGNIRRTQRLSLGSLNSYMSNLKFNDSSSRLPVRKPPP